MARKAKLDILETGTEEQQIDDHASSQPPELKPEGPQPQPSKLRLKKKLVVLCTVVTCVCCIAAGVLFFRMQRGRENVASPADKRLSVAVADVARHNVANLDNFVIDYPGQGDTVRIAIFALAVELNEPVKKDAVENQVELRSDIYMLSKRRTIGSMLSPKERGALRSEIAAELEKRLGAGAVKAVYFTKFYVL